MAACRECGQVFQWTKTAKGKWQPTDPDGKPHGANCPKRVRREYPADTCLSCGGMNVKEGPGTETHYKSLKCLDCNAHRWLPHPRAGAA